MLLSSPEGHGIESGPDRGPSSAGPGFERSAPVGLEGGGDGLVPGPKSMPEAAPARSSSASPAPTGSTSTIALAFAVSHGASLSVAAADAASSFAGARSVRQRASRSLP